MAQGWRDWQGGHIVRVVTFQGSTVLEYKEDVQDMPLSIPDKYTGAEVSVFSNG